MDMIKKIKQLLYYAFLFSISCILAVLTGLNLIYLMITKGPKVMFKKNNRDKVPECLTDPSLGTHGYLHLEVILVLQIISVQIMLRLHFKDKAVKPSGQ